VTEAVERVSAWLSRRMDPAAERPA
jgi:hypothetical protein